MLRLPPTSAALIAIVAVFGAAACGSSTETSTIAPSSLTRCNVTPGNAASVPAAGGGGTITVAAARECSWSATADGAWISIRSGSSGQGDGVVEFAAAQNPDPVIRRGAIVLNDKRVELTQAAGECVITLAEAGTSVDSAGGSGRVDIRASSPLCTWRAEADVNWIVLRAAADGTGTASLPFDVLPTAGSSPRTGTIRVAGLAFTVTQTAACFFTINPSSHAAGPGGGSGAVTINTAAGCRWTATANVSWLSVSPASGSGPSTVTFSIAANAGGARSGTATIAGQPFSVTQQETAPAPPPAPSPTPPTPPPPTPPPPTPPPPVPPPPPPPPPVPSCEYRVRPLTFDVNRGRRTEEVEVETTSLCAWTATSNVGWIQIVSGAAGAGDGEVEFNIRENDSNDDRSGTLTVAGQTVTVNQRRR